MADLDRAVIITLGSNLAGPFDSCERLLEAALTRLGGAGVVAVKRSGWWRSLAWPDPGDPPFVNGAAIVETTLPPRSLMAFLLGLEANFGRRRAERNAARTLDLDVVAYGRLLLDAPGLRLPHPRAHERRFVMGPIAEIAPDWRHPRLGRRAVDLAAEAPLGADAAPI